MNETDAGVHIDVRTDATVVSIHGRLDLSGVDDVEDRFHSAASDARRLVVDLSDVDYISSSAIRMILGKSRVVRSNGGQMVLCRLQPLVSRVFEMTRLNKIIPVLATVDEAVQELRRQVP